MQLHTSRKAQTVNRETLLVVFGLLIAAAAIWGLFDSAKDALDREALYKNYLARDIALIIGAVYAAPGTVEYFYPFDPKYTFSVRVSEGLVEVADGTETDPKSFSYRFAYDPAIALDAQSPPFIPKYEELVNRPLKMKISKQHRATGEATVSIEYTR